MNETNGTYPQQPYGQPPAQAQGNPDAQQPYAQAPYGEPFPGVQQPYGEPLPGAQYHYGEPQPARPRMNPMSVLTLVLSFFFGYVAVIIGVISLRQNWVKGTRGNGITWAGIIVGAVFGVLQVFVLLLLFWVFGRN